MSRTNYVKHKDSTSFQYEVKDDEVSHHEKLPPNIYKIAEGGFLNPAAYFIPIEQTESLVNFDNGMSKKIVDEIENFFSSNTRGKFEDISIVHKMGLLLYGPPGTGKTSIARLVMQQCIDKYQAVCFDITNQSVRFSLNNIRKVRKSNPDSPFIIFCDEVEYSINSQEEIFLPFLDGNDSIPNSVFIGCTNYLSKIPIRIRERKSRIKKQYEIKSLPIQVYKEFINSKASVLPKEIADEFSFKAEEKGLNIDQFKNAIIDYYVYNSSIEEAIEDAKATVKDFD